MSRRLFPALGLILALAACGGAATGSSATASTATVPPVARPRVYVANQAPGTVSIIDPRNDSLMETVNLQQLGFSIKSKPHDIAVEPDGSYWYVTLIGDNLVVKLDRENHVVARVTMETPGLLALDPRSDLLYVTRTMSAVNPPARVGLIHRSTMSIEEVDILIPRPHGMAVDPRGRYAYASSMNAEQIATVDGTTGQVTLSPMTGDSMRMIVDFAVSPDGRRLVATDQMYSQALVFDATDPLRLKEIAVIPVDTWPWHVAYTPDGNEVWFGDQKGNSVTVLDAHTWKVLSVIKGLGLAEPHGIAISPDGKMV
ncbi:MAG: YncE family protein, partial [Gemmatimonadota bacterium]